jgi:uncharacterized membrane protein YbhN (UPF0104 family)
MPENANTEDADPVQMHRMTGPPDSAGGDASGRHGGDRRPLRWQRGRSWRAIFFAPVGDGQTRRRGSDATRLGLAVLVVILCWLTTRVNSSSEHTIASVLSSAPNGIRWLVTTIWWVGSVGLIVVVAVLALLAKRWSVIRDVGLAGLGAWLLCIISGAVFGTTGGRPPSSSLHYFDLSFPVARVAATVGVVTAALPYLSRWVQRTIETVLGLLALATVVNGSGLPVAVLASLAVGWGMTALVHIVFGSPLGLQSTDEVALLLGDLKISAVDVVANARQEWGVGRFTGRVDDRSIEVSVYGRDASDAQLLAKTVRFLFYRDSGPTLALTRRQEVEHEAYLTLMAERAGARVPAVLAAGPAGPARDALLVTRPPSGAPLSSFPPYVLPTGPPDSGGGSPGTPDGASPGAAAPGAVAEGGRRSEPGGQDSVADQVLPFDEGVLDDVFRQVMALREAGIAHGSLSTETIVVDEDGSTGMVDFRAASTVANADQLNSDMAATLAALAVVAGPERTIAAAARIVPSEALVDALPFLQRAALAPVASKALRGKKAILTGLRDQGAAAAGVEVPKLIEPRRVSWVNLALVVGTLVGGWALIAVLVNVTKSWSTITGAKWGWVALVFVLAQAAYPAIAVTTVGSVTDPLPYGRTVALEVSDTFVGLAGGSLAVLATRVRFFQQEGYDATTAVTSGVLVSTASWIVKGALFLIALPLAYGSLHFNSSPTSNGSSSDSKLVWLIVIAIVVIGVALGLVFAVPRWRRLAAAKLRPKASEVWAHLKVLAAHPRNLVEIFGGNVAAQLFVAMALGASLHAFGDHLNLSVLIVVLTLGSMLGGISPVPGGMGVVEAGMILGLTAAGINESDAVAAVFVQRLFTAYLPPIWGWFVLVWMRKKEYL